MFLSVFIGVHWVLIAFSVFCEDLKARYPEIDWVAVAAAGNVYRHDYDGVDEALVWHTARKSTHSLRGMALAESSRQTGSQPRDFCHAEIVITWVIMRSLISGFTLFAAGLIAGIFLMQPGAAQQIPNGGLRLNHVGIYTKDFDESMRFYTKTMGFREAFLIKDKDGKPTLTYLQLSKDTFLELAPATAERPAGLSHIGLWPENLNATVALLRQRGVKVDDPRTGSTLTSITNAIDPDKVRLELLDFLPGSLPRKAMDEWK